MKIGNIIGPDLICSITTACALIVFSGGMARADETFAQFNEVDSTVQQWSLSTSASDVTSLVASGQVEFSFSGILGLPFSGPQVATFSLSASTSQPGDCGKVCGSGDSVSQFGYSGSFSFIDTAMPDGEQDLLSGVFAVTGSPSTTGAQYGANIGSTSGTFTASATPGNLSQLTLTSDYLNFSDQTEETAAFALSSLIPAFAVGPVTTGLEGSTAFPDSSVDPFTSSGAGTFSSNPGPTPEPATLFLLGGGLLGLGFMRRKNSPHRAKV